MSLRGTLGDFGIADIFQLIGHQAKTGVLLLKDREIEVKISFVEGNVVKAEQSSRDKADLLGNIMVRAKALNQAQLENALVQQQRTLRRLGDILVEMAAVDRATLKEFARLQTTETIYRLFSWKAGTYEFVAEPVDYDDASYEPIRSENILMEGFRMVDEWPAVRRVIPSADVTFRVLKDLPPVNSHGDDDDDDLLAGLDDALSGNDAPPGPAPRKIGAAERAVFAFVVPGRTVGEMIDLSRLGEFETSKALAALVSSGVLAVVATEANADRDDGVGRAVRAELKLFGVRVAVFAGIAAAIGVITFASGRVPGGLLDERAVPATRAVVDAQGQVALARIRRAIGVHVVERGRPPLQLQDLVDLGLLTERDLHAPYALPYGYRLVDGGRYELALPLR